MQREHANTTFSRMRVPAFHRLTHTWRLQSRNPSSPSSSSCLQSRTFPRAGCSWPARFSFPHPGLSLFPLNAGTAGRQAGHRKVNQHLTEGTLVDEPSDSNRKENL